MATIQQSESPDDRGFLERCAVFPDFLSRGDAQSGWGAGESWFVSARKRNGGLFSRPPFVALELARSYWIERLSIPQDAFQMLPVLWDCITSWKSDRVGQVFVIVLLTV